jgi:hypothetical protein
MATIDLTVYPDRLERTIEQVRERNIIIPTFAQMKIPAIPAGVKEELEECGLVGYFPAQPVPHHLEERAGCCQAAVLAARIISSCPPA